MAKVGPLEEQELGAPVLLEVTSPFIIQASRRHVDEVLRFHGNFYWELALQRRKIEAQIQEALRRVAAPVAFSAWQRAVKYRYSLHPLCSLGSLVDPGGRFNIGEIDAALFPTFSALYLAEDKETALQEMLGRDEAKPGLSRLELALTKKDSLTIISVEGSIEAAIDLRKAESLNEFVSLIKKFKLPTALVKEAKRLKQQMRLIRKTADLLNVLTERDWRKTPMQLDVPAPCQIFGHLAYTAGVDGIVYRSTLSGRDCVAIFPAAFADSSGFLKLNDPPPDPSVVTKVDSSNWQVCEKSFESLRG